jgi:hypothetical protein
MSTAVPAAAMSLLGYACAPRRATKTYLGVVAALSLMAAAAWTYLLYLGNGPTHYEPIGPDFVASLLIFPSLALAPAASVYPCVSGVVAPRWILPMALMASIVALPFWLWICLMVLHYVVGGM